MNGNPLIRVSEIDWMTMSDEHRLSHVARNLPAACHGRTEPMDSAERHARIMLGRRRYHILKQALKTAIIELASRAEPEISNICDMYILHEQFAEREIDDILRDD